MVISSASGSGGDAKSADARARGQVARLSCLRAWLCLRRRSRL